MSRGTSRTRNLQAPSRIQVRASASKGREGCQNMLIALQKRNLQPSKTRTTFFNSHHSTRSHHIYCQAQI